MTQGLVDQNQVPQPAQRQRTIR